MKHLAWFIALFAGAVLFAKLALNPGFVVIVYPPWRIELSLTLFLAVLLLLLAFSYFLLHMISSMIRLPSEVRAYRNQKLIRKGREAMMEALTAFFEGRYAAAERAAVRAMESGDNSGINPIIAARSAHELREFDKRDQYLEKTAGKAVGESTMRLIAQTEFMLDEKQPQLALHALREIGAQGMHKHIGALQLELKAQQQAKNWDGVLASIAQLEKRSAIAEIVSTQLRQQAWTEKLREHNHDLQTLQALWKTIPSEFRQRPKIAALAATSFIRLKDCKTAYQLLTDSLDRQWSTDLVTLYGDCQTAENLSQIEKAEGWLKLHSDDSGLLLALGKLCLHGSLWGKAQTYLEASISLKPGKAAYLALAQLYKKLEQPEESARFLKLANERES